MPAMDPLASRVARRYMAEHETARRNAIEYQRRTYGLERVEPEEDVAQNEHREGDAHPQ